MYSNCICGSDWLPRHPGPAIHTGRGLTLRSSLGHAVVLRAPARVHVHDAQVSRSGICGRHRLFWSPLPSLHPSPLRAAAAEAESSQVDPKVIAGISMVLFFGVSNRVLYKMALQPMAEYVFFLAQFQNISYLLIYFTMLYTRWKAGLVSQEMLRCDKRPLMAVGACEAVAQLLFMISASHLPGPLLPVVNQSYIVWNLGLASLFKLKTSYSTSQLIGCSMIVMGVVLAAAPSSLWPHIAAPGVPGSLLPAAHVNLGYVVLCTLCFAFSALASIIKDVVFRREKARLGGPLDIFIVNSFGSLFQSMFVLLLLPITCTLHGMPLTQLPEYLAQGARCFQGLTPVCGEAACTACLGAPLLPVLYVAANLAFNISVLTLLRKVGSVTTTIAGSCLVPLTILAFTLPLPYLPPYVMSPGFSAGASLLCLGILAYNFNVLVQPLLTWLIHSSSSNGDDNRPAGKLGLS